MGQIKVLIADDEPEIRTIMARKVAEAGFSVVSAADGQEAWDKIIAEAPDVIVLDLMMPRRDGFSVLKDLRQNPPSDKWQPVIIVSAKKELADMQQGFALDADHYITKPCKVEDVIKGIQLMVNLIPQHKTAKELRE